MRLAKIMVFFFLLFISLMSVGQKPFIKVTDIVFNRKAIIQPATDGWVVLTGDSIRLTKFNGCGVIEWSKQYNMPAIQFGRYDFISLSNGDYGLIYKFKKNNVSITAVTRFDQQGNVMWSKSFGDSLQNHYPYNMVEDSQGNIYLFGVMIDLAITETTSYLIKLNTNGNLIWTKLFDMSFSEGKAVITSDQNILLKSNGQLLKTDVNGNILWTKVLFTSQNSFAPIATNDGFVFTGTNGQTWKVEFYKYNNDGNVMWGGSKDLSINNHPSSLLKAPSGNFIALFPKSTATGSSLTVMDFDPMFNIVHEKTISLPHIYSDNSMCFLNDGTPVICGKTFTNQLYVVRLTDDYKSSCDIQLLSTVITNGATVLEGGITYDTATINFNSDIENLSSINVTSNVSLICPIPKMLDLGIDTSFCEGSITLKNLKNDVFDFYSWSTGETTAAITATEGGLYILQVNDSCGESLFTDSINLTKLTTVNADAGPDIVLCDNETALLQVTLCNNCSFLWSNGATTNTISTEMEGYYTIIIENTDGCFDIDTVKVLKYPCECTIYFPNAFSPNNDGKNELFLPSYSCDIAAYQLMIFNRWGEKVFSADDAQKSWNGKINGNTAAEGIYIYSLKYTPIIKGARMLPVKKNGVLTLIR